MQVNNKRFEKVKSGLKVQSLALTAIFLGLSLLVAACGDNTATTAPASGAVTTGVTTAAATSAAITTAATTTAVTTPAATTAATTTVATTGAATTASVTTATGTTAPVSTAAAASTGQAKLSLASPTAQAGTTIAVLGEGYPPNTWVTIEFGPGNTTRSVASLALVDSTGKFNSPLILSAYGDGSKLVPGPNLIKATTQDGTLTATITFTITPAPAATETPKS